MSERRVESEPPGHEATPAPSTSETAVSEPIDPESMLDAEVGTPFEHDRLHIVTSTQGVEAVGEIDHFGRMNVQYLRPTADPDVFELDVEPSLNADVQPSDEAEASKDAEEAEASEEVEDADDDGDDELAPLQPSHQSPRRSPRTSPHKRASPQSSRPASELDRDLVDLTDTALVDPSIPISRRDRLLKAAGNEPDFGKHNLHRLFDRDNDGRLSHAEFQSGLLALGMEIDRDNAGTIEEDEFVQFFKRLRMDDITRKLQGFSRRDPVRVKVVSYCASSNHAELNQHVEFDLAQFKDWLDNRHRLQKLGFAFELAAISSSCQRFCSCFRTLLQDSFRVLHHTRPIRSWVTVKGYDPNVADMLSVALDIHEEILQDVVTIQRDKIEIVGPPEKPFAHILASVYAMNNSPIYVPSYGLANVYVKLGPNVKVVTIVRSRWFDVFLLGSGVWDPDVLDSPVYNVVRELEDQIIRRFPDVILGNVKYLAYLFLEAVSELNYDMRDVLKQWLEMIDDGISQTPRPEHRAHLFEYAKVSSLYMREMSALANRLHTLRWDAKVEPFSFFFQNESVQDEQTNNVLLLLTLVTTIFIPAQFLTGLWGMNFEEMPELHWRYGYVMFWSLVAGFTIITILWFRLSGYWQLSGH
ncbi:uncharacterized protein MONBRDRAFT_8177 [Monosiga brevicollis MX1]|uniref:EF-hand domain-containing protein n=1 Tax=Monosiga brevicollis TaxID=81824 RepID=A9UZ98_MONBE|nr:uncharacterized protein MONBRDRAFT_8177 [Monosiga brevicollis MX1]EDQ89330.1 predicted protein [Monosiga brevicollis MX1]|eukprot:XP_001745906.1 hypothetical protein [Monosiga brevicollis MX1]